jgi:hypothetical protein
MRRKESEAKIIAASFEDYKQRIYKLEEILK